MNWEVLKVVRRSMAFSILLLFWGALDLFAVGTYIYGAMTGEWLIDLSSAAILLLTCIVLDIAVIPIWFIASCFSDCLDPYVSVWDDKEVWDA